MRIAALVLAMVAGFHFFTMHSSDVGSPGWMATPGHIELTEAAGPSALLPEEVNNIHVYQDVLPSVVSITSRTVKFDFFYGEVPEEGLGSGFIIDHDGHILTNFHVVADAREVQVTTADKRNFRASVVGVDQLDDLAVLQIKGNRLQPATLGDSVHLQVGQEVYAIGNPFGLSGTMTRGIISSLRPVRYPNGVRMDEAIQTDAAINPGNSGGPLLNSHGDVIGINSFIVGGGQSAGLGFAIPINVAKAVVSDLISYGRVLRPTLGVRTLPVSPDLAQQIGLPADNGVLILQVVPGSAAERAGLRGGNQPAYLGNVQIMLGGDLIVAIDGRAVQDQTDLAQAMNRHKSGDTVVVTIYRGQHKMDVKVTLGEARQV